MSHIQAKPAGEVLSRCEVRHAARATIQPRDIASAPFALRSCADSAFDILRSATMPRCAEVIDGTHSSGVTPDMPRQCRVKPYVKALRRHGVARDIIAHVTVRYAAAFYSAVDDARQIRCAIKISSACSSTPIFQRAMFVSDTAQFFRHQRCSGSCSEMLPDAAQRDVTTGLIRGRACSAKATPPRDRHRYEPAPF